MARKSKMMGWICGGLLLGLAIGCGAAGSRDHDDDGERSAQGLEAIAGYEIFIWMGADGVVHWAAGTLEYAIFGTGFPPAQAIIYAGASEATVASAVATVTATPTTVATVSITGTTTAVTAGTGSAATGTVIAGGLTVGTVATVAVVTVGAIIAVDCVVHGECVWTTVNNAGGAGVVLGYSPAPNQVPNTAAATAGCYDQPGLSARCTTAMNNYITNYYSWFGGAYWTCRDVWRSPGSSSAEARAACATVQSQCVNNTLVACCALGYQAFCPAGDAGADGGDARADGGSDAPPPP